jgi:hypothetical protein
MPVYANTKMLREPDSTTNGVIGIRITGDIPVIKPTCLAVAVDTSGSMSGERIDSVKRCLKVIINRMRVNDIITVIAFSSTSTIILSNFLISEISRSLALEKIDELVADGGTNAEAAISTLGTIYQNDKPDAALFLTDGHINEGICSNDGLHSLLKSYLKCVPFFTIGYGESHNAELLRHLALKTKATYTFAESETALPASMGELLSSLQHEVAKNVLFSIPNGWTCLEPNSDNTNLKYEFGSIIADKATWGLFSISPNTQIPSSLTCVYIQQNQEIIIPIVFNDSIHTHDIIEQEYRCIVGKSMDKFATLFEQGNTDDALAELKITVETLRSNTEVANRPLVIRMIAQMEEMIAECKESLSTPSRGRRRRNTPPSLLYRSRGIGANYSSQRGTTTTRGVPEYLFSSPTVIHETTQMIDEFSQIDNDPINESSL